MNPIGSDFEREANVVTPKKQKMQKQPASRTHAPAATESREEAREAQHSENDQLSSSRFDF